MIGAFRTNGSSPPDFDPSESAHRPPTLRVRNQERTRRDWPKYVVMRDGKFLQERTVVRGFLWESPPFVWTSHLRLATKYPRTIARLMALERGGEAVQAGSGATWVRSTSATMTKRENS